MSENMRRLGAIIRKELITLTSYRIQMLMKIVNIGYFAVSFYFIGEFVGDPDAISEFGGGYFEFVLIGSIVTTFAIVGLSAFGDQISDEQDEGTLEAVLTTPTPMWTMLAASFVVPLGFVIVETIVLVGLGLSLFGSGVSIVGLLLSTPVLLLTTLSFVPLGVLSASFILLVKRGDPFSGPVQQFTLLLSGALYPLSVLPGWLEGLSKLLPATYGVEATRQLAQADAPFTEVLDEIGILVAMVAISLPLTLAIFRRTITVARRTGTLGTY